MLVRCVIHRLYYGAEARFQNASSSGIYAYTSSSVYYLECIARAESLGAGLVCPIGIIEPIESYGEP